MTMNRPNRPVLALCEVRSSQSGFALVLALLALMLLTFLGLTLAATTSTELQIATNYRWSQQALFNAESGVEAGKSLLRSINWTTILPAARTNATSGVGLWDAGPTQAAITVAAPFTRVDAWSNSSRNFENSACDTHGAGMGYGVVLDDGTAAAPYQYKTSALGFNVNGAFTLWVRRPLVVEKDGKIEDFSTNNDNLILVSEGTAPYQGTALSSNSASANRATQVIEVTLSRAPALATNECGGRQGQTGNGPEGTNFGGCNGRLDTAGVESGLQQGPVTEFTGVK